jgi:pimeloyl-ACP methyl ester carboxylesterase
MYDVIEFRKNNNKNAIVFIHGFTGKPDKTWIDFAELLKLLPEVSEWDIFSLGYPTSLRLPNPFWSSDPGLQPLSEYVGQQLDREKIVDYDNLAIIAHSMGGLIVQRLLLDGRENKNLFTGRVKHVLLFATPSHGLKKALIGKLFNRQVRDMYIKSDFITKLRRDWDETIGDSPWFSFKVVAGLNDVFVPPQSSLEPFPEKYREWVPGDHNEIVTPVPAHRASADIVVEVISGGAAQTPAGNTGRSIVESRMFQRIIHEYLPNWQGRSNAEVVDLALALEVFGRAAEAEKILEERMKVTSDTDIMGVRAGRLKRSWLLLNNEADGKRALDLYSEAYDRARNANDIDQAFYQGINVAFMNLAFKKDKKNAVKIAVEALGYCNLKDKPDKWSLATQGEAYLITGEIEKALAQYREAIKSEYGANSREIASMYTQAQRAAEQAAGEQGAPEIAGRLDEIFQGE